MNQTFVNLETTREHLYIELRNDVTSVSLNLKKNESPIDFPLMQIIYMNIKLKIKVVLIYITKIASQKIQNISL